MTDLVRGLARAELIEQLVARWMFLTYLGMAFAVTYRSGFVNLGISGQLIGGAYFACLSASLIPNPWLALGLALIVVWGLGRFPVYLRYRLGANEILTTLFLTYIAISVGQFVMRPEGNELIVASPQIPADAIPAWFTPIAIAKTVSIFHLPAIPLAMALELMLRYSLYGYEVRVACDNPQVVGSLRVEKMVGLGAFVASCCVVLALMGDTYVTKRRHVSHDYDDTGFLGIAVALIAISLDRLVAPERTGNKTDAKSELWNWRSLFGISALPCAALFVAFIEVVFRLIGVSFGVPQRMSFLVFGGALIVAALVLRRK